MKPKAVILRESASRDIDEAIGYYLDEAGDETALAFVEALERAYRHLGLFPASGSLRYAYELELPGLRCWSLDGFPYLVFYVDGEDHVDVWRVLHGSRNIPAWMREPKGE
ncbi:MAG TPA: type II toxin-antitoxin system RelE/ParE family toxin [Pararhizobium sp.]|nr:type II toxin-antitoxin system RelE/ParE family toxin [Pararhizobium sp.]